MASLPEWLRNTSTWRAMLLSGVLANCLYGAVVALLLGIWSFVSNLALPIVATVVLVSFAACLSLVSWFKKRRLGATLSRDSMLIVFETNEGRFVTWPNATLEELKQKTITKRTVHIHQMPHDEPCVISGRLFDECTIMGPAVLRLSSCRLIGWALTNENGLWVKNDPPVGAIHVDRCEFRNCNWLNVGICVPKKEATAFRKQFAPN